MCIVNANEYDLTIQLNLKFHKYLGNKIISIHVNQVSRLSLANCRGARLVGALFQNTGRMTANETVINPGNMLQIVASLTWLTKSSSEGHSQIIFSFRTERSDTRVVLLFENCHNLRQIVIFQSLGIVPYLCLFKCCQVFRVLRIDPTDFFAASGTWCGQLQEQGIPNNHGKVPNAVRRIK